MLAQNDIFFRFVGINVFVEFCAPEAKQYMSLLWFEIFYGNRLVKTRNLLFKRTMCINYTMALEGNPQTSRFSF